MPRPAPAGGGPADRGRPDGRRGPCAGPGRPRGPAGSVLGRGPGHRRSGAWPGCSRPMCGYAGSLPPRRVSTRGSPRCGAGTPTACLRRPGRGRSAAAARDPVVPPPARHRRHERGGRARCLGEHDFAAFCRRREGASTVRELLRLEWSRPAPGLAVATVVADAFCHNMVRALVGALLRVGDGAQAGRMAGPGACRRPAGPLGSGGGAARALPGGGRLSAGRSAVGTGAGHPAGPGDAGRPGLALAPVTAGGAGAAAAGPRG